MQETFRVLLISMEAAIMPLREANEIKRIRQFPLMLGVCGLAQAPSRRPRAEAAWLWTNVNVFISILSLAAQPVWENGQSGVSNFVSGPRN